MDSKIIEKQAWLLIKQLKCHRYKSRYKNYYEKIVGKWVITSLKETGLITGGGTPKSDIASYWNGNILWVTPADMSKKAKYIQSTQRKISNDGLEHSSAKIIEPFSIIMSSRAPIGYICINKNHVCTSQGCKSFTPFSDKILNIEYVFYYLKSQVENIQKRGSGTTFKEISGTEFGNTIILIPPIEEQKRIVMKIGRLEIFFENCI